MDHLGEFFKQGVFYFLFYENLLSLTLLIGLIASSSIIRFQRALGSIFLFCLGLLTILLFGSLGFQFPSISGFNIFLFSSVAFVVLWNFTLRPIRGMGRRANPTPRYAFSLILGLLHGLECSGFFGEIGEAISAGWVQALVFWSGILIFSIGGLLIGVFAYSMINSFLRVKPRDWNLIISALTLGLAIGFLIQ